MITAQPGGLNLRSMRDLAFRLGVSREMIATVASRAGEHYRPFHVERAGKKRLIDNPTGPVRFLQDRIHEHLLRPLELPEYLHGGVPGRSPKTNAMAHLGQATLVTADVADCFPSITHKQVFSAWRDTLGCTPSIARLLTQLTTFKRRLPQGAPTSTTLANLVLHLAGKEVREGCTSLGLAHSTFIDDLAFSGERAPEILNHAAITLRRAGLRLPHRKIRIMRPGAQKRITGIILGPRPTVPKETKSKIRAVLFRLRKEKRGSVEWDTALGSARGLIAHATHIDPKSTQKMKRSLNAILSSE